MPIIGENDLATTHPELAKEWDYSKNIKKPQNYKAGSNIKVSWVCQTCGYKWDAIINSRVTGRGCPRCAGKVPFIGVNDLATTHPNLLKEWDYENNKISPSSLKQHSRYLAYWVCSKCGNKWQDSVASRTRGKGCPNCKVLYKK